MKSRPINDRVLRDLVASGGLNASRSQEILKAAIIKLYRVDPILSSCRAFLIKTTPSSLACYRASKRDVPTLRAIFAEMRLTEIFMHTLL